MTKSSKESTRQSCSFQCIGASKIPPCGEHGYFLEKHIVYQVFWLDYINHVILYSYLKEDLVRQVLEEMKILFEQNQKEV